MFLAVDTDHPTKKKSKGMDDRKKQFRVGVVVFATMIVASILILMNSDFSWSPFREQYQLQVLVDQRPALRRIRQCADGVF